MGIWEDGRVMGKKWRWQEREKCMREVKGGGEGKGWGERGETGQSDGHWRLRGVRWKDYSRGVKSRDRL